MKKKHFYSHLIETSSLSLALGDIELTQEERVELTELADTNIHHTIIEELLAHLPEKEKKLFLLHVSRNHHDKVWDILKTHVQDAEKKIQGAFEAITTELLADIKKAAEHG